MACSTRAAWWLQPSDAFGVQVLTECAFYNYQRACLLPAVKQGSQKLQATSLSRPCRGFLCLYQTNRPSRPRREFLHLFLQNYQTLLSHMHHAQRLLLPWICYPRHLRHLE
ncbi:hypothetical protein MRX96_023432 [Rhipicephalus microplus]